MLPSRARFEFCDQRIVLVADASTGRRDNLRQTILEIPGELCSTTALRLCRHVAVVAVQIRRSGGRSQPVEWLIAVRRAALRTGAIADRVVRIRFGRCSGVSRRR